MLGRMIKVWSNVISRNVKWKEHCKDESVNWELICAWAPSAQEIKQNSQPSED